MNGGNVKIIEKKEVRRIRDLLGFTQKEFAKELEVSKITIARWESGSRSCKGISAKRISDLEKKRCSNLIQRTTSVFSFNTEDLSRLDSAQATQLFRDFLFCEARRVGIPFNEIDICLLETPDGGIDARVNNNLTVSDSVIMPGANYFQIKAGVSAKPWQENFIQKELFGKSGLSNVVPERLGKQVLRCLDENGRYVLVCFGHDLTGEQRSKAEAHLVTSFAQCGYRNVKVEVWGQQQLKGMISPFLSLCLQLTNRNEWKCKYYSSWMQDQEMVPVFYPDEVREGLIKEIRNLLLNDEIRHIRLIGNPGIGKTRLALEILGHHALFPLVVYIPNADNFQDSLIFNNLCKTDADYFVILVLDNCSSRKCKEIWNSLRNRSIHCRIVSIDSCGYETYDKMERVFECPCLSKDKIETIIKTYIGNTSDVRRWAEFCSGSALVAHVFGQNLLNCPDDLFREPSTVLVWDRYIAGPLETVNNEHKLFVLKYISLFERFGFESPVREEGKFIYGLINKAVPEITWVKFQSIIQDLKRQRILKGETTLHITPKALHIYLWLRFWNDHGRDFFEEDLIDNMPSQLIIWFRKMFPYAHASPIAFQEIQQFLELDEQSKTLNFTKCQLLNELAPSMPEKTLTFIEASIGHWSFDNLLAFKRGRQEIVWALEKIAWWPNLFYRAAEVLRKLAETEEGSHSNNSKGTFANFFSLTPGFSPTGAAFLERLPVLENAINSTSTITREVGLCACRKALSYRSEVRIVDSEHQGLRQSFLAWMPKTWEEVTNAYLTVWKLLFEASRKWNIDDRAKANADIIDSARYLFDLNWMREIILITLNELVDDEATDLSILLDALNFILRIKSHELSPDLIDKLKAIDARITGTSLASLIRRWIYLSGHNDQFDDNGDDDAYYQRIRTLASEVVSNEFVFNIELPKIIKETKRVVYQFGKDIGDCDIERNMLIPIIDAYRHDLNASPLFLSGYLKSIFDLSSIVWEEIVLKLIDEGVLSKLIGPLIRDSGFTDASIEKLLFEYDEGRLDIEGLLCFYQSNRMKFLTLANVQEMVVRFQKAAKISYALELMVHIYSNKTDRKKLPDELTIQLLKKIDVSAQFHSLYDYHWNILAEQFISQYPDRKFEVFDIVLDRFFQGAGNFTPDNQTIKFIKEIVAKDPEKCWSIICSKFDTLNDVELFRFSQLFKLGSLNLMIFPSQAILDWVAEYPHNRASAIASIVPPLLTTEPAGYLARELLNRYGDQDGVQDVLLSNFFTESWCGPASEHFQSKHDLANEWLKTETSLRVRIWLEKYISILSNGVMNLKIKEEREFY